MKMSKRTAGAILRSHAMTLNLTAYRLRQQRKRMRLTQREVADRLHVSAMTISKYETCRLPPTQMLIELARLYGVSTDYLLGVTDGKESHD